MKWKLLALVTMLRFDPQKVAGLVQEGTAAVKKGYYAPAITYFTQALSVSESYNPEMIYSARSLSYFRLKKYQESLDDAEKTIKLKLSWSKVCFNVFP